MPPGRPSKRIGESVDGNSSDEHGVKVKPQRTQKATPQNDFSSVVKSKLQSYTRTGQACDRCKVRKIRCDALSEGCSHCTSQNLECYVTDRVTGRTERRGYTQELEREKSAMLAQIRSLEKTLESHGIHAAQFRWHPSVDSPRRSSSRSNLDANSQDTSQQRSHLTTPLGPSSPLSNSGSTSISAPQDGTPNRPQLVAFDSLTLSILGNDIDLGGFQEAEMRGPSLHLPAEPVDYTPGEKIMLHTMLRLRSPNVVELPTWSEALHYTEWWFTNIYPFLPILHKPSFLSALRALYETPASPAQAPAHTISIHVVFATTLRQIASTSLDISKRTHLRLLSDKHYLYALSRFGELVASRNVQDLRALALILFHATRYSKPRFSVLIADQTLGLSIELGMNRARPMQDRMTKLEDEMRKRLWWTVLWLTIILRGRTCRPMPLGLRDMDLDYPDALSDESIEQDVKPVASQACPFLIGLAIMKATRMYLHMFSTIYSIQAKTSSYLVSLRALEQQLKDWQDSLPASLRLDEGDIAKPSGNGFHALYIHYIGLNFQLYLHHPMALPSEDPVLLDTTLQATEDNSRRLLRCLLALHRIRSLEPTWLALATYTSGAFLHLTSHWHRRNFLSEHEMVELRQDMMSWSMIIEETSQLLGNGPSLPAAVHDIVQRVLTWIEHDNQRMANESRAIHATREMAPKRADQEPAQISPFSLIPHNPRLSDLGSRGSVPFPLTSRPDFYGDPSVANSAIYGQALAYTGTPMHPPNAGPAYTAGHTFGYGEQVRIEPPRRQNHDPAESQRAIDPMESYGPGTATGLSQNSHSLMWRPPNENTHDIDAEMAEPEGSGSHGGTSWGDWTTTMTGSQDHRYGSQGLMAMSSQSRQGARPEGGMRETSGIQMNVSSSVPVTGSEMPWPGMMYPANPDRQQRPE